MTEPEAPPHPAPPDPPDPPDPSVPPASDGSSSYRGMMVLLAYLWVLVLVPLVFEEKDEEVRWHARHGLVLMAAEFMLWVIFQIAQLTGFWLPVAFMSMLLVASPLVRFACIFRGISGGRLRIPVLTPLVDRI